MSQPADETWVAGTSGVELSNYNRVRLLATGELVKPVSRGKSGVLFYELTSPTGQPFLISYVQLTLAAPPSWLSWSPVTKPELAPFIETNGWGIFRVKPSLAEVNDIRIVHYVTKDLFPKVHIKRGQSINDNYNLFVKDLET